jgi:hypothetical protein
MDTHKCPSLTPDDLRFDPHFGTRLYPRLPDGALLLPIVYGLNILNCMIVVTTESRSVMIMVRNNTTAVANSRILDLGPL